MSISKRRWAATGGRPNRKKRGARSFSVAVSDTRNVEKLLDDMPRTLQAGALSHAVRGAGGVVARNARARLRARERSDRTGGTHLDRSISTRVWRGRGVVASITGPRAGQAPHAHLVEFGFMQKWVKIPLTGGIKAKWKTPKKVPAKPFLRPAADTTKGQQQTVMVKRLKERISDLA